jgi:polyhydroxyalkanoate synthase
MAKPHPARQKPHNQEYSGQLEEKIRNGSKLAAPFCNAPPATMLLVMEQLARITEIDNPKERSERLDRLFRAYIGQASTGFSPVALILAYTDWLAHLMLSPFKVNDMLHNAQYNYFKLWKSLPAFFMGETGGENFKERYKDKIWGYWPYNILAHSHLLAQDWWQEAGKIRGMSQHHKDMVSFLNALVLSAFSPENFPLLNPEIRAKTFAESGRNYLKGMNNALVDAKRYYFNETPAELENYRPGKDVAVTKGKVIFRNHLFELIQYKPATAKVYAEPVLIIPAWIMKYYILDLSPHNSLVRYLVEKGHTVFMMSWKNPDAGYREVSFIDYLKEGALQAVDVVRDVAPGQKIQAVGYCIGGTLLAMLAAYLANKKQDILGTITLFAALTDFTEPGQLQTFIDEAQVSYLEDVMFAQGFLRGEQLASAFDFMQPEKLIWQKIIQDYMLGERAKGLDLIAWDKDLTRLPYRMHSEYLQSLYLDNSLAEGEFEVDGEALDLDLVAAPIFLVSTEKDHIAPWKSVYKLHYLTGSEITFALANKGHNGGIISEPGHKGREYRIATRRAGGHTLRPRKWLQNHEPKPGSWWVEWESWLASHTSGQGAPLPMGGGEYAALGDAPGKYIYEH